MPKPKYKLSGGSSFTYSLPGKGEFALCPPVSYAAGYDTTAGRYELVA